MTEIVINNRIMTGTLGVVLLLLSPFLVLATNVTGTSPATHAQHVSVSSNVTVTFDFAIPAALLTTTNFKINGAQSGNISGTLTGGNTNTIIFDPAHDFVAGEVVTVTLATGFGLTNGYSWQFTTASAAVTAAFVTITPLSTAENAAYGVYPIDLNNDHDVDILSVALTANRVSWYENIGTPTLTTHHLTSAFNSPVALHAGDLDNDGDADVVVASAWDSKLVWYQNDGNAGFSTPLILASTESIRSLQIADMDNDGDKDVVAACESANKILVYENNGSQVFTPRTVVTGLAMPNAIYVADVDGDHDIDVLSSSFNNNTFSEGKISWFENQQSSGFVTHTISAGVKYAAAVYAADVDSDGDMDALSVSDGNGEMFWHENNGSQIFTDHIIASVTSLGESIYAADIDGDGDMDVLANSFTLSDKKLYWYENNGTQVFTPHAVTTSVDYAMSIYAADVDNDGDMDVMTASLNDNKVAWYPNNLPPVIAGAVAGQTTNDQSTIAPFSTITVSDRDAGQKLSVSVQLDVAAKGNFTAASMAAAGFVDVGSGKYTFTGTAAAAQAALRLLEFAPTPGRMPSGNSETVKFTITANDAISPAVTNAITTVVVTAVTTSTANVAPSFTKGADVTVNEDASAQTRTGWATNISPGPANESSQVLNFQVSNNNTALFTTQPGIDASGTLTFQSAPNANGTATITVILKDNGGTANGGVDQSTPITFVITVNPVNDVPSFTKGADVTVTEDASAQTRTGWATNLSAGPANESSQALNFQVSNNNTALFTTQPGIDALGTLTFQSAPNANGTATVTVVLKDNGGTANGGVDQSTPITFMINITPVNDAPSFTKGADVTANEDASAQTRTSWATNLSAGPANESSQVLNFQVSNNNTALFTIQPGIDASGTLTFQSASNANGTATVTVVLKDNGGTTNGGVDQSSPVTFVITVNSVNDAPSFTKGADVTVNEDASAQTQTGWAANISAGPANESSQILNFQVSNNNTALFSNQPGIDASGTLTFQSAPNANGTATITVVLKDNGGIANGGTNQSAAVTFTITINPVNDAPLLDIVNNVSIADGNTETLTLTGLSPGPGEGNQHLTVTASSSSLLEDPVVTLNGDGTATMLLISTPDNPGVATITVVVHDDGGTDYGGVDETEITFTVTVEDVLSASRIVFIPTLFSPNGDGVNDVFRVRAADVAEIHFCVYSADGYEVFRTTDLTEAMETGWNGQSSGRDMPSGTYTWTLHGHFNDGSSLTFNGQTYGQVVLLR